MPQIRCFALAAIVTFVGLADPFVAFANTKCLCNDGMIVQSMDDDSDACDDACDEFGGGRVWTPEDAGFEGGNDVVEGQRVEPVREQPVRPPARGQER
jgi:hypothetical protein